MKKTIVLIVLLAGSGLVGWQVYQGGALSDRPARRERKPVAVAVEISPVQKAAIRDVGIFTGTLIPSSQFVVAPKIAGRLEKLMVNIGDRIKTGQPIAVLEDDEYRQQLEQSQAELQVAKATLEENRNRLSIARRELARTEALRKKKIASESELDAVASEHETQQAKLKVASAQVGQKEAALRAAQVRLAYTQIRIPTNDDSGHRMVGERFVDEGAMLAPNTPIVSILDIGSLIAVIHVIERDYAKIKLGLEAEISTDAFPGKSFSGKILRKAPLLKETSRQARVEIEIRNDQELLKPGMFVRASIQFAHHTDATLVPLAALVKRNGEEGVFVADTQGLKARFVPVQVGIVEGQRAEITQPDLEGFVVTLGQHLLEEGSALLLPDKSASAPTLDGSPKQNRIPKPDAEKRS